MSEMTMVERVALAIWRKREDGLPDRLKRATPDNLDRATGAWGLCLAEARAAIEAMRCPTDAMIEHGGATEGLWSRRGVEAYISAALAEPAQKEG